MAYEIRKKDAHPNSWRNRFHWLSATLPTKLMKDLEYGKGYQYAHDTKEKLTDMQCLPDALLGREYYHPTEQGREAEYGRHLQEIKEWKRRHSSPN